MVYVRFARKFLGRSIFRIVEFLVVWVLVCKGYVILAATTVPSSEARVYSVWVGIFAGRLSQRISEKDLISSHYTQLQSLTRVSISKNLAKK